MIRNIFRLSTFAVVAALLMSSRSFAVGTSHWVHTTTADFSGGKLDNVVATSLGELKLSRATRTLLNQDARVSAVYALAEAKDGAVYAATGPQGVVLRIKDGKTETAATLGDDASCFSLLIDHDGRVLVGVGGPVGKIYRIDKTGEQPKEIFSAPDVQYIWSMAETSDGNIYAATGPNGQLFEIHPDGTNKVLFDSDENNLLSLVSDGGDLLYAGSDPNGHVYRVNRKSGEVFVVFDAPETEISALAIDSHGVVYAGTGQSTGQDTATEPTLEEKSGRPETENGKTVPLPGEPEPSVPEPPKIPLPGPGDPQPIPKEAAPASGSPSTHPLNMLIDVPATTSAKRGAKNEQLDPGDDPSDPSPTPAPSAPRKAKRKAPLAGALQQAANAASASVAPGKGGEPPAEGNAIYRIELDGSVTEIFREPVLVLSIYEKDGLLLVATGGDGRVYQINPAAEETATIAKLDPKEALCLLPAKNGEILVGLANDGQIAALSSGYAESGTFVSPVLDAQQISKFGQMHLHGNLPTDTALTVSTRSGNVADPTEVGWSKWTDEAPASQYLPVKSSAARFLQYRLTFSTKDVKKTAVVDEVNVAYQTPNRAPVIKSVTVSSPTIDAKKQIAGQAQSQNANAANAAAPEPKPEASSQVSISWDASDPNGDAIQYTVYYRTVSSNDTPWTLLKEKLTEATYEWNTRSVADGRYEIKIVASDALANPQGEGKSGSRVSEAVEVDNTPPIIGDLKLEAAGDGSVKLSTRVVDRTSTVANLEFSVDSSTDWQAVLPSDTIADSPQETYAFTVGGLSSGSHQISLRATDDHGNQGYETVTATVGK